ncbi:hypothetical protein QAD02_001304 [Eretmocerus hayati]|uniref:Uncharacterized protein n=1 Tax=Eretmocerus hayati TaxID=131215 RepID=A0ACC2NFS4_9HYME|nr:hypothetical protein QAD02_001304 [Eretmocerus hayati]
MLLARAIIEQEIAGGHAVNAELRADLAHQQIAGGQAVNEEIRADLAHQQIAGGQAVNEEIRADPAHQQIAGGQAVNEEIRADLAHQQIAGGQAVNEEIRADLAHQQIAGGRAVGAEVRADLAQQGPEEAQQNPEGAQLINEHLGAERVLQPIELLDQIVEQLDEEQPMQQPHLIERRHDLENNAGNERRQNFDERMEEIRGRAWHGAVEAAFGGDAPHVVIQRQLDEEERIETEDERLRAERDRENRLREERLRRYQRVMEDRRRQEGPRLQRHHNRVIRLEFQFRPRILDAPAPGLIGGVVPFNNLEAPQNNVELEFFDAVNRDDFLVVNEAQPGGGPVILHVAGLCVIAPDNSTWRCMSCLRAGCRNGFGGWVGWWMHHLHLTGLRSRIPLMRCPGCNMVAFNHFSRHTCQACLEVYHAHRRELLIGVVFEAMLARVIPGHRH